MSTCKPAHEHGQRNAQQCATAKTKPTAVGMLLRWSLQQHQLNMQWEFEQRNMKTVPKKPIQRGNRLQCRVYTSSPGEICFHRQGVAWVLLLLRIVLLLFFSIGIARKLSENDVIMPGVCAFHQPS